MTTRALNILADDRILPATRLLAALVVPFLIVAFVILYLLPDETGRLFAWEIRPRMTALLMGAGYIAGGYFFVRTVLARRWHHVAVGFLPVTIFAAMLMVATLIHWDLFNHRHVAFIAWVGLYATTPFLVFVIWLRNRDYDPGTSDPDGAVIPAEIRLTMAGIGAAILVVGLLLFLRPELFVPIWPWPLTPATARSLGPWFVLPGVFGVLVARDPRWGAARLALQSQLIGILLILVAVPRAWSEFDPRNPLTWVFLAGMLGLAVGIVSLFVWMEGQRRATYDKRREARG